MRARLGLVQLAGEHHQLMDVFSGGSLEQRLSFDEAIWTRLLTASIARLIASLFYLNLGQKQFSHWPGAGDRDGPIRGPFTMRLDMLATIQRRHPNIGKPSFTEA